MKRITKMGIYKKIRLWLRLIFTTRNNNITNDADDIVTNIIKYGDVSKTAYTDFSSCYIRIEYKDPFHDETVPVYIWIGNFPYAYLNKAYIKHNGQNLFLYNQRMPSRRTTLRFCVWLYENNPNLYKKLEYIEELREMLYTTYGITDNKTVEQYYRNGSCV